MIGGNFNTFGEHNPSALTKMNRNSLEDVHSKILGSSNLI